MAVTRLETGSTLDDATADADRPAGATRLRASFVHSARFALAIAAAALMATAACHRTVDTGTPSPSSCDPTRGDCSTGTPSTGQTPPTTTTPTNQPPTTPPATPPDTR